MNNRIKVLHIIKNLSLGGAEVNLLNLCRVIDQNLFEIHVAYSFGGELENKFKEAGIELFKYADKDFRVKSIETIKIVYRLANYIRNHKIQIIHTHTFSAHIWGCIAAKLTGCKIIEHVHDFRYLEPEDFSRRRGFNNQYKFVHNLRNISDRVVVLTGQNKEFLVKNKIYSTERIREYQNGIPISKSFKKNVKLELAKEFGFPSDSLIILTPIRLAIEKNVDLIIGVAPEVLKQVPNAIFLIAGDGPLYEETLQKIQTRGLKSKVKMIGYHSDIKALLSCTDVFLLPSFLELHSIAILEAMSVAIPIVISQDVGCNSEFIDNWHNGILLDPFKEDGWAEALVRLLKNPDLRKQIGHEGYMTCTEKFDIQKVVRTFEELYASLF